MSEVHVWPNSHPRGGVGYVHCSNMEDHAHYKHPSMNTKDIRQEVWHDGPHRVNLYDDIHHSRCLPSQHSTKPDKYDGSARVSLSVPTSTDQIKL
jgi:hypothetical protein